MTPSLMSLMVKTPANQMCFLPSDFCDSTSSPEEFVKNYYEKTELINYGVHIYLAISSIATSFLFPMS